MRYEYTPKEKHKPQGYHWTSAKWLKCKPHQGKIRPHYFDLYSALSTVIEDDSTYLDLIANNQISCPPKHLLHAWPFLERPF